MSSIVSSGNLAEAATAPINNLQDAAPTAPLHLNPPVALRASRRQLSKNITLDLSKHFCAPRHFHFLLMWRVTNCPLGQILGLDRGHEPPAPRAPTVPTPVNASERETNEIVILPFAVRGMTNAGWRRIPRTIHRRVLLTIACTGRTLGRRLVFQGRHGRVGLECLFCTDGISRAGL